MTITPWRVLAIDHRDSLLAALPPAQDAPDEAIVALKADLVAAARGAASGVMLDPRWGMDPAVRAELWPDAQVIAALEDQGYLAEASVTHTTLLEDWDAAAAVARGATAVKILSLWSGAPDPAQDAVIAAAQAQARAAQVPLISEPLPRGGLPPWGPWVLDWVAHAEASGLGDVLKVPHPGSAEGCAALTAATGRPWVLLSAGADFDTFTAQLRQALAAGAAGYIVGRAVWREAATLDPAARRDAIATYVVPRLQHLGTLASA